MTKIRYTKKLSCLVAVLGALVFCEAKAATIYVDQANTGGPWDGTTWATAWTNITDGLSDLAASNAIVQGGHTVMVSNGTYSGEIDLTAAHAATNTAARNVLLGVGEVIVDGGGATYCIKLDGASYFTIQNLRLTDADIGIWLWDAAIDEHYTVQDCRVYENGYGIKWKDHYVDDLTVTNSAFYANTTGISLGAVYMRCVIANCVFIHNDENAVEDVYNSSDVALRDCVIAGNGGYGAAEGSGSATIAAINCLFYKNSGGHFRDRSAGILNTADDINDVAESSNNVVSTPGFADLASGNLRLLYNDSPCLGNGTGGSDIGLDGLSTTPSSPGYIYYVATDGNDTRTPAEAQNPLTPWQTIQHAADSMDAGDTARVAAGMYTESVVITNAGSVGKPVQFLADDGAIVDGGSVGFDLQQAVDVTVDGFKVISCSSIGIRLNRSFGCTISRCTVDADADHGIYLKDHNSGNLVSNCVSTGHSTYGIYIGDSGQLIVNCDIHDNGYGVFAGQCSSWLQNCNIYNNTTHGLYHHTGGVLEYDNCNIVSNAGYGLWLRYNTANAILRNCNIIGAGTYGIYEGGSSDQDAELYNCNIYDCPDGLLYDGDTATAYTNIADINTLAEPVDWYTNNISVDPMFENAAAGDFRLADGSPCIDKGTLTTELATDYYGNARLYGAAVDIGVYEYLPPPPPAGTVISIR